MNCNVIFIILTILILICLFYNKQKDHYNNVIPYDLTKKCRGNYLLNGVCYPDMKTCEKKCPAHSPPNLKKNNYCIDNHNGVTMCYPSTW